MKETSIFYEFGNNSAYNRSFTVAWRIHPRSEMHYHECPECGIAEEFPRGAFDVDIEGGTKYPDILGCGAYPFLIVSESVVMAWQEAEITCFHKFPVGIAEIKSRKLREVQPPRYWRVEIDGGCKIDLPASGVEVIRFCPECHHLETRPSLVRGFQMVSESWDGCPIFRDGELYPRVNFCNEKVLEIARQHRFSNFRFEPMQGPFDSWSKGIEYLASVRTTK